MKDATMLAVRVEREFLKEVQAWAAERDITVSQLVRMLLAQCLAGGSVMLIPPPMILEMTERAREYIEEAAQQHIEALMQQAAAVAKTRGGSPVVGMADVCAVSLASFWLGSETE